VLFVVFTIQNWLSYPPDARAAVVPYDLGLVVLGFTLYGVCGRVKLSSRGTHLATTGLAFAVLGQILLTTLYGLNPLFTHYVSILLIASAGAILATRWVALIAGVAIAGWAAVAARVLAPEQLGQASLVMMTSAAIAAVVHVGRRRSRARIVALRVGDARREQALEHALADADEARRGLDHKVEERTAALRSELAERERLEAQLRHAQKLEAVGQLAGSP
jgi:hypothetical protein